MSTTQAKHTKGPWTVRPAWTRAKHGGERRCGWHLMNGGDWAQTFRLKREAQAEADQLNAIPGLAYIEQCAECREYDADAVCPQCRVVPAAITATTEA